MPPLTAAGISPSSQKSVSGTLEALADALEPFNGLSAEEFTELVKVAREYRESGQLPDWVMGKQPKAAKAVGSKPPKASAITPAEAVAKLRELQDRSSEWDPSQIAAEMQPLNNLTGPQLKEVQKEFLGVTIGKNKSEQLAALRKRIDDIRSSRGRVDGILSR